ncbi:MAG: hydantoinase/oxoprolinase family protein [Actinomycetia bacterium]|nr:hydantoinase/oxoprolinase family protein [Actinomycetes bacterium]
MLRVGIDVGGTFTDLFAWRAGGAELRTAKVMTTPNDLIDGVLEAVEAADLELGEIETIVHGSTTATNALIERTYPEPAFITTEGFRDTIEMGRPHREHLYDPYQQRPAPLVRRTNRYPVREKIRADGSIRTSLDEEQVRSVARRIAESGTRNVAVGLINSYANSAHERRIGELVREEIPGALVALSSDNPKFRELPRFVTAVVRAALLPVMGEYLERLEATLRGRGFEGSLFVIKSNGGMIHSSGARECAEELIESGPAGGVAAAAALCEHFRDGKGLLCTDMGGTSFDVCLIEDGQGLVRDDYEIDWDLPIVTPMLDIRSVGAGGGSIAWIDGGGSIRLGPRSAGADPGPACYGRGGTEPTVTDANLLLGRLEPTLGGKLRLDPDAAERAVATVAEPLGLAVAACAEGIVRLCVEQVAAAMKLVSVDRGRDPRDYRLVSFGGAGPMHAAEIAALIGVETVIVPPLAGVASAFGGTMMDVRYDIETTFYMPCEGVDLLALNERLAALDAEGVGRLEADGFAAEEITLTRTAGMRYVGQSYEVDTPLPAEELDADAVRTVAEEFNACHLREHGVASEEFPAAFVNLRASVSGAVPKPELAGLFAQTAAIGAPSGTTREVLFGGIAHETPIYQRRELGLDARLEGPAIIQDVDATVLIPPGDRVVLDSLGNVVISIGRRR